MPPASTVIAAPNRPAEMRSFDPDVVTRLLDLVSSHFDYVVIDMPRTWFSWTDSVLLGSNRLFIVSEMTVPGLRHAKQLVDAIRERLGDGPKPQVIVNRFEQRMFASGLTQRRHRAGARRRRSPARIPNNYRLVREAIDRGVPLDEVKAGNNITAQLKKLMLPQPAPKAARQGRRASSTKLKPRAGARNRIGRMTMAGRFTAPAQSRRRAAAAGGRRPPAVDGADAWTVLSPELPSRAESRPSRRNPLLSDKLLDAKVRLHRRLIEEINLSALEKLPEDEMRRAHPAARHAIHRWSSGSRSTRRSSTTSSPKSSTR